MDNRTDAFAFMHQVERFVDVFELHGMGDEVRKLELTGKVAFNIIGQLGAAFNATKRRAAPDATGDQLERTGRDFLTGTGNTDNDRLTPALVAALKG